MMPNIGGDKLKLKVKFLTRPKEFKRTATK